MFEFGPFCLDAGEGRLLRDGKQIPLTPKVFETLLVLVRDAGHVLSRDTLLRTLWPDSVVGEANLTQNIWVLRKALEDPERGSRYIETVPRRGYRFVAEVRRVERPSVAAEGPPATEAGPAPGPEPASPAAGSLAQPEAAAPSEARWARLRELAPSAAALVLVALLAAALWPLLSGGTKSADALPRRSVAVLGFKNLSGRPEAAWLSTAFAEMLATDLAAGGQLRTVPGEDVARVKADLALPDTDSLARDTLGRVRSQVGADLVVLGSYLESAGTIRLDIRLQDAALGETIASVAETGREEEILDVVARSGNKLRASLGLSDVSTADADSVRAALPSSARAARLYAEGLARLRVFDALGAKDLLQKAAATDPEHSLVHSALAEAWAALGYDSRARDEAKRAFELSSQLGRQERLLVEGRYREAARESPRAIAAYTALWSLAPDEVDYGLRLAHAQVDASRPKDALVTVAALRRLPEPLRDDPRIDLAEAEAAEAVSDFRSVRSLAAKAVEKGRRVGARLLVARARLQEGRALRALGDLEGAASAALEARRVFAELHDPAGVSRALNLHGNVLGQRGDLAAARAAFEESLAISEETGSKSGTATCLNSIAGVLVDQGDLAGARKMYEQSLAMNREMGDRLGEAIKLNNIANVILQQGDLAGARKMYEESLAIAREIGNKLSVGNALNNIALVLSEQGDMAGAEAMYEQSLAVAREIGDKGGVGIGLNNLASMRFDRGDLPGARKMYEESLAIAREMGDPLGEALALDNLASLAAIQGDLATASQQYETALGLNRRAGTKSGTALSLHGLGEVAAARGDLGDARRRFEEALAVRRDLGEAGEVPATLLALGQLDLDEGRLAEAESAARSAAEEYRREKRDDDEALALALLARTRLKQQRLAEARATSQRAGELAGKSHAVHVRLTLALATARVEAVAGSAERAARDLDALVAETRKLGLKAMELEARLAQGELDPRSSAGRSRLAALEREARTRGFGLIATKAAAAAGPGAKTAATE